MNDDIKTMFDRHAKWQSSRATLSWSEKLREAIALRRSVNSLSAARQRRTVQRSQR